MSDEFIEYDESDLESDFEDLEYDEARRRRRRGRGRGRRGVRTSGRAWQPQRPPTGGSQAATLRREAEAGRARDKQLARELTTTKEELGDTEGQLRKVNADLSRLRQISLISMLLPRSFDTRVQRLTINQPATGGPVLAVTEDANAPGVNVVTSVGSKLDILPVVLFMTMARGIGTPGRAGSSTSGLGGDNMMMPLVLILLMQQQQQQQQAAGGTATTTSGGLDSTALLLVLMASGGLS